MIFKKEKKEKLVWIGRPNYLLLIPLILLTTICICLFHKIVISSIAKCMTEPPTKIMMTRLEAVDQIYRCIA